MITVDTTISPSSHLSIADLGGEAVILDTKSGSYFGLNKVGMYVLEQLKEGARTASIIAGVVQQYGISESVATKDVLDFLNELVEAELVETQA